MFPVTLEISKRMNTYIEQRIQVPNKNGIDAKDVSRIRF